MVTKPLNFSIAPTGRLGQRVGDRPGAARRDEGGPALRRPEFRGAEALSARGRPL
jgi:hypothetical protein